MWPRAADSDSVPVGVSQTASTRESFHFWFQTSGYNRHRQYILEKSHFQEKICAGKCKMTPSQGD